MKPAAILCDADGCLFPSEEEAFAASVQITNEFLEWIGSSRSFSAEELRRGSTGKNFRTTASELAASEGVDIEPAELERWVEREAVAVTDHLGAVLQPDPPVIEALESLAEDFGLALVSSSALRRIDACLGATGLTALFPPARRYSAEDSLLSPKGKPDPAVYLHAMTSLGLEPGECVAVEDSVPGVQASVAAGIPTMGMLSCVPDEERSVRARELIGAGAWVTLEHWSHVSHGMESGRSILELAS